MNTYDLRVQVLLLSTFASDLVQSLKRFFFPVQPVQTVCPLEQQFSSALCRGSKQLEGRGVIIDLQVQEQQGLVCGQGRGVES